MRTLDAITRDFNDFKDDKRLTVLQRTMRYVRLMDELEQEHDIVLLNATDAEKDTRAMRLYRAISLSRVIR